MTVMTYNGAVACFLWTAATSASEVKISFRSHGSIEIWWMLLVLQELHLHKTWQEWRKYNTMPAECSDRSSSTCSSILRHSSVFSKAAMAAQKKGVKDIKTKINKYLQFNNYHALSISYSHWECSVHYTDPPKYRGRKRQYHGTQNTKSPTAEYLVKLWNWWDFHKNRTN